MKPPKSLLVAGLIAGAAGCGKQNAEPPPSSSTAPVPRSAPSAPVVREPSAAPPVARERGPSREDAFLARIRGAAAGNGVVTDARLNGSGELGVVLGSQVKLSQVRNVMTSLLKEMRDEFPGRPLGVIAYAPNGKPLATMRYDPSAAPNANVTYKPNFTAPSR